LRLGKGYDHCYVLADAPRPAPVFAARVVADGVAWEVATTEPGVQFYSGNNLKGAPHPWRSGLCLETQHFPNSPNQPDFPSTVLRPGMTFRSVMIGVHVAKRSARRSAAGKSPVPPSGETGGHLLPRLPAACRPPARGRGSKPTSVWSNVQLGAE
jgi:hypothetical protein